MDDFALHSDFGPTSVTVGDLALCRVQLQNDARWPWLILIPRRAGVSELDQLTPADRAALMDEQVAAMAAVRTLGEAAGRPVTKLNVAALGNVTPQLHVHVIGRHTGDPAWPKPVWGVGEAAPYSESGLIAALTAARDALGL